MINRFRRKLLDRAVLRPSRGRLEHAPQQRHVFHSRFGNLDYFTQSQPSTDGNRDATDPNSLTHPWLVLKFPGTSGRAERSSMFPLDLLPQRQGHVWTLNPPGYGNSEGRASLSTHVDVATEFVDFAISQQTDPCAHVVLCGNSLGSATVLGVAARICQREQPPERPRLGLLLRNVPPLTQVVRRAAARFPLGQWMHRVAAATPCDMDAIHSAAQVNVPAVFLVSERDTLVPPELQQQVIASYRGNKRVVLLSDLEHDGLLNAAHLDEIAPAMSWLVATVAAEPHNCS